MEGEEGAREKDSEEVAVDEQERQVGRARSVRERKKRRTTTVEREGGWMLSCIDLSSLLRP